MKRWVAMTCACLLMTVSSAHAQETTLKFGHAAASQHLFQDGLEFFAEKVAEKTGGAVKIEVYGDRQLGDDRQLLEGLQIATIDGALVSSPTLPLVVGATAFDALQLPFLVNSYEELAEALASPVGQDLLDTLDAKNMKGLGYIEAGQRHFLSRAKQVASLDDFTGQKTRIVPIPLHKATWEAVGVNPIGMAYGEVYSALETGTIDAVEINVSSIRSESLYEAAKHVTKTGHYFWPGVIIVSGPTWARLSDDVKTAMIEAGRETTAEAYARAAAQESETVEFLKGEGVEVGELDDIEAMRARTQPVVDSWLSKDPLIQGFFDHIQEGR